MKEVFDRKLFKQAGEERFEVPEEFEQKLETMLAGLPKRKRSPLRWKTALVAAAVLSLVFSSTAFAVSNYVKQRMEALNKEKIEEYFSQIHSSPMNADSYSRDLSTAELEHLAKLKQAYAAEGKFPEGELKIIEEEEHYKNKGVAFLPQYSMFFFPEGEMTQEELLQYIDFMAKRDYSLGTMNEKINAGEEQPPAANAAEQSAGIIWEKIQSNKDNIVMEYNGDMKAEMSLSVGGNLYFSERRAVWNGETTSLYKWKAGEQEPVKLEIQAPDDMQFWNLAADTAGNIHVMLFTDIYKNNGQGRFQVWKLDGDGKLIKKTDVSQTLNDTSLYPDAFAVDDEDRYYFIGMDYSGILVTDQEGKELAKITGEKIDVRALSRGKDGKMYASILEGEEYTPGLARLDADNGKIDKIYSGILPGNMGAYDVMAAGADCDFLFLGFGSGVYSFNLGDEKAKLTIPLYELPAESVTKCLTEDGRIFVSEGKYDQFDETKMDFQKLVTERFYWIPAE